MRELRIIEVKSEIGAGTRGSGMGVDAIKTAALDFGSRYFKKYKSVEVPNENHLLLESAGNQYAKRISGILTMVERISDEVSGVLKKNEFPIMISGDHSCSIGAVSGIKKAFPKSRIGLIWIDAHADIHSPYTTPSGNLHGMPLAALLDEDNLESKINKPDQETLNYWYQLKNVCNISPKIKYGDLVYISMRDLETAESNLLKRHKIRNFSTAEIRKRGVERVAIDALKDLDSCDMIYVSFDVDALDPSISRGTGTPVSNGITGKEAGNLVARLMSNDKICGFDMVEVNPTLDRENKMAENAFEILLRATNSLIND
ncbi:arginase [Daejeonella sp. H1SJ63]|jgi:arginase|uniref:arginase n=1 Tax=Daejeonella sp. H1SJ63 TaxID=3034145 RepID=UPI0023EBE6C7|nr:arginase [Daejeonella sp. H1SJ63]